MNRHSKKTAALLCAVCILASLFCYGFTSAAEQPEYDCIPIYINGVRLAEGYKIEDTTYIPIRAFSESVSREAALSWEQSTRTVTLTAPGLELTAVVGEQYMTANGRYLYVPSGIFNLDGTVVVPIRQLAKAFGVEIIWDAETKTVNVDTAEATPLESGDTVYNEEGLYWLSRLINAESGNQPLDGKIAVGNVVLNRVESELFPDTIYDVISQPGQFDVYTAGTIYDEPNDESVIAAKLCLEGTEVITAGLFFVNPETGSDGWFRSNCAYIASIEDHDFYA